MPNLEKISYYNPEALTCDGFDDAIVGMAERINLNPVVAYSVPKMIEIMMQRDGMTYEEAYEYYEFNILGAWVGDNTPVFINSLED